MNNRSGFTLLEIIVVIIIVGVLASLALPRFFQTINFSRSTEALNAIGVIKRAIDHCAVMVWAGSTPPSYASCIAFPMISIENPGTTPGASFDYFIDFPSPYLDIIARAKPGSGLIGSITMRYDTTTGTVTWTGTNEFAGIQLR